MNQEIRDRLGNIDQIRDILFGNQLRDYDNRFRQLESEIAQLRREFDKELHSLREDFSGELNAAVNSLEKKLQYLSAAADEEMADIRQQLDTTDQRLSNSILGIDKNTKNQFLSLRESLSEARNSLDRDIQTLQTQIFEELEKRYSTLSEVKLSRDDLAELLFDLCMRVKGTKFVPEEKEGGDNNQNAELLLPDRYGNE
jgi:predicted  nucleic acid-binding Zn-ribbon protein